MMIMTHADTRLLAVTERSDENVEDAVRGCICQLIIQISYRLLLRRLSHISNRAKWKPPPTERRIGYLGAPMREAAPLSNIITPKKATQTLVLLLQRRRLPQT